MVKKMKKRRCK